MIVAMKQVVMTSTTTTGVALQILEVDHKTVIDVLFRSKHTRHFAKIGDLHDPHPFGQERTDPHEIISILMSLEV